MMIEYEVGKTPSDVMDVWVGTESSNLKDFVFQYVT